MLTRERPQPSPYAIQKERDIRVSLARFRDARGRIGQNITTRQLWHAIYGADNDPQDWGNRSKRAAFTRRLKNAAVADIIDGEWDGKTYRWSLKEYDPVMHGG